MQGHIQRTYRYKAHYEIPAETLKYVANVAGIHNALQLTIGEINDFLNCLEDWSDSVLRKYDDV